MTDITLFPCNSFITHTVNLPGSKSIANRVLLLAAVADGVSLIEGVPIVSEDVNLMLEALVQLGVTITLKNKNLYNASYIITGCKGQFPNLKAKLYCGNSGTTLRFLSAILAVMPGNYILHGNLRMHERPIGDLIDNLTILGANITYLGVSKYPPLQIQQNQLNILTDSLNIRGDVSSQFVSALLMSLALLRQLMQLTITTELISKPYVEITIHLLKYFGCNVITRNNIFIIDQKTHLNKVAYIVEPDASTASYFMAIGAINGSIKINNLTNTSVQGDVKFAAILSSMGAQVVYGQNFIQINKGILKAITINMNDMPDVALTLAVLAILARGVTIITGIKSWQIKECNRLTAMQTELKKLGAKVIITTDSITIVPPQQITQGVVIDTYDDHRIAMCFSILAFAGIKITIKNIECVAKTFAGFFELINQLIEFHQ